MLEIIFKKQTQDLDYKKVSRDLRNSKVFGKFVRYKSRDRKSLCFNFDNAEGGKILEGILFKTLDELKVDYDVLIDKE